MTTQKPISKSPIYDAFLSKNADRDYLANSCFCERYVDDFSFHFTGKEKDPETGYSYFGARYLEHELMTMWLSVDPMADKYPSISPYAYCAWNPVKLVDLEGEDWYQKGNDYYWSNKVVSRNTTPKGCRYIGSYDDLYKHFGLPALGSSKESSQWVQTLVGTNVESNNPFESKYYAFGILKAKAKSSITYSIQKDAKTGKLNGIKINASLETAVPDNRSGGYAAVFLDVSCGDVRHHVSFKKKEGAAFSPRDIYSRNYINASITIPADLLSENCFSELQITGPWFNNETHMSVLGTLNAIPSYLKHKYL